MFARPRPRKNTLVPPPKKRKVSHAVEEIKFDSNARDEYLTGFHKRKLQRARHAQEEAAKRARQEKIDLRKQLREDRKREVEDHVQNVTAILKEAERAGHIDGEEGTSADSEGEEWGGFVDAPALESVGVDHEEEYIDEDRFTTVTVESVNISRDGLSKPEEEQESGEEEGRDDQTKQDTGSSLGGRDNPRKPKKKKQKFRYETKTERQLNQRRQKAKKKRNTS